VEDRKDSDLLAIDAIWEKVRCAGNDEFARSGVTAAATETWIANELVGGIYDATSDFAGSLRLVLFDVGADFRKLGNRGGRPDYSHAGGGSSLSLPQERSQRRTSL
jgi:hypothetical protein